MNQRCKGEANANEAATYAAIYTQVSTDDQGKGFSIPGSIRPAGSGRNAMLGLFEVGRIQQPPQRRIIDRGSRQT
jgi:hypothetical protein